MKCPVCDKVNTSMLCPNCGFDSSRDYGKYPTFGHVTEVPSISSLRKDWHEKQKAVGPPMPVEQTPVQMMKKRMLLPLLIVVFLALTLGVGLWIVSSPAESEEDIVQVSDWRSNVLKADDSHSAYVYGTKVLKSHVCNIVFLDSLDSAPGDAIDVSVEGDGSVMLWWKGSRDNLSLFYAADGGINAKEACSAIFYNYGNLISITLIEHFHTDEVESMKEMFRNCYCLTRLYLSSFDMSNVKDTTNMFYNCPAGADWQHLLN